MVGVSSVLPDNAAAGLSVRAPADAKVSAAKPGSNSRSLACRQSGVSADPAAHLSETLGTRRSHISRPDTPGSDHRRAVFSALFYEPVVAGLVFEIKFNALSALCVVERGFDAGFAELSGDRGTQDFQSPPGGRVVDRLCPGRDFMCGDSLCRSICTCAGFSR